MVHGGCHGAWQWEHLQTWFAERGWDSIAIDWLSHGDSARLEHGEWLCRDITAVQHEIEIACTAAAELGQGAPIVMGHSMGGLATLAYAASTARELAGIVLLTPVVPEKFGGAAIELEVDADAPWGPPPPEVARQLFYSGVDEATAAACYERLQPESPAAVWQATRWTAEVDISAVRAPALVVAAEADLLVPADYVLSLADGLGAEQILLPGVGHGVTLDPGWPQLAERIETWLSKA
ncbi:alpha/beta hydrolase [Nonomuraea aridisoli]|uniref:AB hydrolase-1 domain-containing protein n=1 Tax=Nonomuraea aridisoli TaxID=2070368 RepID=A0A2W2EY83_9ACTN|nr:alpha/beta fold hydrolase [Nonomuraea aridisoli]PZG14317.1 hypothetical protein C1J01_27200 [Nonomuraea aridisoli]